MKCTNCILSAAVLIAACGGLVLGIAFAQEGKPAKPAGQPADAAAPAGQPSEAEMMEMYKKAGAPGPMHARLAKTAGAWKAKTKMWMAPGAPASESEASAVITPIMGGRFTSTEFKGSTPMGEFQGKAIIGYNTHAGQFESLWIDDMSVGMMWMTGTSTDEGKTITYTGECMDPMTKQNMKFKNIEKLIDDNTMVFEMYNYMPDGSEFKSMEINYTRDTSKPVRSAEKLREKLDGMKKEGEKVIDETKKTMTPK